MLVKTIIDHEEGRKWEIYKEEDNKHYYFIYYEYYSKIGWRKIIEQGNLTIEVIEWDLDVIL